MVFKYPVLLQVSGLSTPARGATSSCTSWTSTLKWPATWWRCGTARGQTPCCWVRMRIALLSVHFVGEGLNDVFCHFSFSAVLTGDKGPTQDLYSTTNQMSVWFLTDKSGYGRGFRANFTSGVGLGLPGGGGGHVKQQHDSPPLFHCYLLNLFFVCVQLHVQMISSSVTQEAASTATSGAMMWSIVPTRPMKQTVVSRSCGTEIE